MKRQHLRWAVFITLFGLIFYLGYNVLFEIKSKNTIKERLENIPNFNFLTINDSYFSNSNLLPEMPIVFIYFNSQCDLCKHEAESINDNMSILKNIQFIFVSMEDKEDIQQFSELYGLSSYPNVTFLNDRHDNFYNLFGVNSVPYILIYDENQKLIKKHRGQLNSSGILKVLN